jgi:integrase/recombinase XerD
MRYQLQREVRNGQLIRLWLGMELVDEYLDFLKCRCRPNTWLNYAHDLKVFFNIVGKPVANITPQDIFHFIQEQRYPQPTPPAAEYITTEGVCIRTIKRRLSAISGLYDYLLTRGNTAIQRNPVPKGLTLRGQLPASTIRSTPLLRAPRTLPQIVPVAEVQRFLASLHTYRDKAMGLLMALGGLRKSEVLGLELADLNEVQGTVLVKHGKGGRQRICCVAPLFFQTLTRYLNDERPAVEVQQLFLVLKGPRRGQPLSVSGLNTIIAHHCRLAQTPGLTCHRLRHTCFTMLREAGMSLEALQQQAGHQSINTTRIYLHLSNHALREEYLAVSERLFKEKYDHD